MPEMLLMEALEKMEKTVESYQKELNTVRTGRANPNLLDSIRVEYYGVLTPIKQISSITVAIIFSLEKLDIFNNSFFEQTNLLIKRLCSRQRQVKVNKKVFRFS